MKSVAVRLHETELLQYAKRWSSNIKGESVAFGRQLGRVEHCASQCCNDQSHVFFDQSHVFFDIFPIHLDHLLVVLGKAGHLFDSRYREKKIEC
jgi:hypothetical protein